MFFKDEKLLIDKPRKRDISNDWWKSRRGGNPNRSSD